MTEDAKSKSQLIASWSQTAMLAGSIVAAIFHIGKRDQQLEANIAQVKELSSIVTDLAKSQVTLALKSEQVESRLKELVVRIEQLERNKS